MLDILTLIPRPIKDVIMPSLTARENPNLAAERLIRSSIRISIAVIGLFSSYKLLGTIQSPFLGVICPLLSLGVVYISSMPAGNIMYGLTYISFGALTLTSTVGLKVLAQYSLTVNLLVSAGSILFISVGLLCIHESEDTALGNFTGCLEPYIENIVQKYQASLASRLSKF